MRPLIQRLLSEAINDKILAHLQRKFIGKVYAYSWVSYTITSITREKDLIWLWYTKQRTVPTAYRNDYEFDFRNKIIQQWGDLYGIGSDGNFIGFRGTFIKEPLLESVPEKRLKYIQTKYKDKIYHHKGVTLTITKVVEDGDGLDFHYRLSFDTTHTSPLGVFPLFQKIRDEMETLIALSPDQHPVYFIEDLKKEK